MGVVWLARDQRLGRRVALKVIEHSRLTSAGARERFRREAAATAQLSHPNIVTLYEVGEVDGQPWVALEYIEGATLRERLADDPPPLREALGIAQAIAGALAAAHRAGIQHRDLKPGNIILGRDGRPRVVDFGLARRASDATPDPDEDLALLGPVGDSTAVGTPRYMAPEQWRREDSSTAADVWSLGLLLHELVHGCHPFDGLDRRALRAAVEDGARPVPPPKLSRPIAASLQELIAGCLDKAAAARPTAEAVSAALAHLLDRASNQIDDNESPFRGLLAFGERHADAFFGRDPEIAAFLERVREEPVLPVVGPSGAGKSSFVQAGVIPRLRERGWTMLHVRPGRRPLAALAQRLVLGELPSAPHSPHSPLSETDETVTVDGAPRKAPARTVTDAEELTRRLAEEPRTLGVELRAWADAQRMRVVLFVDQLEELYAGGVAADERHAFLRALITAADDRADPVRVVFTLRDDFLGRVAEVDEVRAALSRVTVLRTPGGEALHDILLRPAERAGYRWDDGLVDEIVAAVAAAPAGLPLLAFTARQMWHRRDKEARRLTRAAYADIGGVAGALATHADGVIAGLSHGDDRVVRDLLLRLVSAEGTRRVVARSDLLDGLPASASELLQRLVEARLVTTRRAFGADADAEVELAHESLIVSWDRLARWIDEGREDLAFLEDAERAAERWIEHGRRDDDLWRGEPLADARRLLARRGAVPADVSALLAASERLERRARRRRRAIAVVGAAVLAAIAVGATLVALRIAREEKQARHRFAEAQREAARAALSGRDLLAARARLRSSLEVEDSVLSRALWLRMASEPLTWTVVAPAAIYDVAIAANGETVAAVGQDGLVRLIDRRTTRTTIVEAGGDQLFSVAYSPDGRWLATGAWDGEISLWALPVGSSPRRALTGHLGIVNALAFRGDELISAGEDGTLRRWDVASGAPRSSWSDGGAFLADLALDDDGTMLTASWDGAIRRWDADGKATVIGTHDAAATMVTIAGDEVISGGRDGTVRAWRDGVERRIGQLGAHASRAVYDADHDRLLVTSTDGVLYAWALRTGREEQPLLAHSGDSHGLALAGTLLASGGEDDAVRLWDLSIRPTRPNPGHTMTVVGVDVSADGRTALSVGYDQEARLWDVPSGTTIATLRGHTSRVWSGRLLPDGRAVTAAGDGSVRLWDVTGALAVAPLALPGGHFYDLSVAPDASLIAVAATDGRVHLWGPDSGVVRAFSVTDGGTVNAVAFDPTGARIATGSSDAIVRVHDTATGAVQRELRGQTTTVDGVAFSPDGKTLASSDEDGAVWLWDLATGDGKVLWKGPRTYKITWHPGGALLGVASADNLARLLDVAGAAPPRELRGHDGEVNEIRFSADGAIAVTGSNDTTVRVWDVATGEPRWRAPDVAAMSPAPATRSLDDLPSSPVTARAEGPAGTVALGFASGVVGLWHTASGQLLHQVRVHGAVVEVSVAGATLRARSELGDRIEADLSALTSPYCDLLRDVWARVPITIDGARPAAAGPPAGHRCAP